MEELGGSNSNRNSNIYKVSRSIKRKENTLYNALRSIYEDSIFVGEISQLWPELPLLANLRCGLWYFPKFHSNCYFKSTDGHTNNLSFNTCRLNLHVALLAALRGGCMIVDSTRKGKRFPDSMSKTIPIWTCVLNQAILNYRTTSLNDATSNDSNHPSAWDCSLHLPLWVSQTEKSQIENRLQDWTKELESTGADIASISSSLSKPLRPLWVSQKTVIWLNEVPDYDSWDFTPLILVSASSSCGATLHKGTTSEFSWNYIPGAGDDEESWARGLSPALFWKHAYDIISSSPDLCNQMIANIVEKDRVARAQRGEHAPQLSIRPENTYKLPLDSPTCLDNVIAAVDEKLSDNRDICFLGLTNIAVGKTQHAIEVHPAYCILNCDKESVSISLENPGIYFHLPILDSKFDRFSLLRNLPSALDFAKTNLRKGKTIFICCSNGEDISICISLAILCSFYDETGHFDEGKYFGERRITKLELRRRLVFICKYAVDARPSRGNLRQVFNYLSGASDS